jgi:DNA polymerase-3 subunit gamma/tau
MSHQVLARKWRPRSFADVIGQPHVVQALANALDTGRIHHAYLFTGTRGVGKTTLARILAKALNCQGPDGNGGMTSKPCGVCKACSDIDAGRFVDLLEVDAATNTKVDEMRELLETAQYAPVSGRYKVYIIDEVHMLSKSAFNAMLKTLEEPPGHVEFILATTDPQKLPITILSRCLQFNLKNLPPALIADHLAHILDTEKIPFERGALEMIGRAGEGSARDSLSLLDQAIAYGAGAVKADQVALMLGVLDQSYLYTLLGHLSRRDAKGLLAEIRKLAERSVSFELTLKDLASVLARVALTQSSGQDAADGEDASRILELANALSPDEVQLFYQIALLGRRDLALAPDEQSGFTMTLLRMLAFSDPAGGEVKSTGSRPMPASTRSVESMASPRAAERQVMAVDLERNHAVAPQAPAGASVEAAALPSVENWPSFVASLNLSGMAALLGRQCAFLSFAGGVLELTVPDAHRHLADKPYLEKLKTALVPALGDSFRLSVKVSTSVSDSLAAHEDRAKTNQMLAAEAAIDQDEFIKSLKQDFGADVIRSSIRPVNS